MDVSIVVPTRNRPDLMERLLRSLERATPAALRIEILVVDNNTDPALRPQLESVVRGTPLPTRLLTEPAPGKSRALNLGIREAKGEFVAFLDDDIIVHEDYLVGLEKTLGTWPHGVFGGRVLRVWPYPPPDWVLGDPSTRASRAEGGGRGGLIVHDCGDEPRPYDRSMRLPIGCNVIVRRSLFGRCGDFDVRLGPGSGAGILGGEETDLLRRLRASGETIFYTPLVVVDHPVDPQRMTKADFRARHFSSGRVKRHMTKRTFPSIFGIPRYLFGMLLTTSSRIVVATLRGASLQAFDRQLELCEILGSIYEYWRTRGRSVGS